MSSQGRVSKVSSPMSREEWGEKEYDRERSELGAARLANTGVYDRSILTLSAGFLAISISFIKDIVPVSKATLLWSLYASWVLFGSAIILSLAGMLFGNWVCARLLKAAREYYIEGDERARSVSEKLAPMIDAYNVLVGVVFALAVVFTVAFAIANFNIRGQS